MNDKKQSDDLTRFYREWYRWAKSPLRIFPNIRKSYGLCSFMEFWFDESDLFAYDCARIKREMRQQFRDAGLCTVYPFGVDEWMKGLHGNTNYKCAKRLAWVREHIPVEVYKPSRFKQFKDALMGIDW